MAKNIVLLSDGTGNSSAQLMKTNVWRVYEALQLTDPTAQVACYDDGVGTSSFKPLAVAGGAFGVGLRRNVLRLYRFLCEHYDPGDRIYLFGFSRGAFTIRVLVGLICDQGIIRTRPTLPVEGATDVAAAGTASPRQRGTQATAVLEREAVFDGLAFGSELARMANWAYRDFRRQFRQTGGLVTIGRTLRDGVIRAGEHARDLPRYDKSRNHQVTAIDFVGVWDTVDAYGLPIDELTDGVDRWIWPLSMPDLKLNPKVRRACHVLALDDERNTFHPVLWDEAEESNEANSAAHIDKERVSQVWFAGMHSNVGGGYSDDALSYVSLKWMTDQASDRSRGMQLLFVPSLLEHHTKKADPFGRLYDSRSGLKGYYRYNPRRIQWLMNGLNNERGLAGTIAQPKIHESVFRRIAAAPEAYAPIVFPRDYAVLMEDGRILKGDANPYESAEAARRRVLAQEQAWDLVWQRRVVYFATVAASIYLLVQPLRAPVEAGTVIELGPIARLLGLAASLLPDMVAPWLRYYQAHPVAFVVGFSLVLLLKRRGRNLQSRICGTMRGIWLKVVPPAREEWQTLRRTRSRLTRFRSHKAYLGAFAFLRQTLLPNAFGILILAWLAGLANRAPFEILQATGVWGCQGSAATTALQGSQPASFASSEFCSPTGIRLERGAKYRIEFPDAAMPANWQDGGVSVRSPAGINSRTPGLTWAQRFVFTAGVPFKRLWSADWFVPVARIGERGIDHYPLTGTSNDFTAQTSGELFLFVNDSIAPLNIGPFGAGWKSYYARNKGIAAVTVTRLP